MDPHDDPAVPLTSGQKPPVWTWYVVYCLSLGLIYVLCAGVGVAGLLNFEALIESLESSPEMDMDPEELEIQLWVFAVLGGLFAPLFLAAPFLPRRPWAWFLGFATIGLGFTSCCCIPVCIPLLIFWIKPATQHFFERH